jgi:hypothetical protein
MISDSQYQNTGRYLTFDFSAAPYYVYNNGSFMSTRAPTRFAYVSLLMKGHSYIPGLIALGASLRASGTSYDFVCMVTPDIDKSLVLPHVTHVVEVPYLSFKTKPMRTEKQRKMYGSWMSNSYTKWTALVLEQYIRILFLDLDVVVLENLDHLFERPAPAATFSNAWADPFIKGKGALSNPYKYLKDGIRSCNR